MGAILSQEGEHHAVASQKPKLHPIAYYSATFTPMEWNYNIYERELLAIMKALTHWRHYLGWTKYPFTILTDHANLLYYKTPKKLDDNENQTLLKPELFINTIYPTPTETEKRQLMIIIHDHPTAGHPGRDETIRKATEIWQWVGMRQWISDYVKGCANCQQNKIITHKKKTPLYHITTNDGTLPFQQIAMDLITRLPQQAGYNAILTIMDHGCSRAAIFLPCTDNITGPGIAQLYLDHMYQWFGLPS